MTAAQLNVPSLVVPPYTHATTFAFDPHLQLPYSWQWNLSLEQALGNNQSVTFSYEGAGVVSNITERAASRKNAAM